MNLVQEGNKNRKQSLEIKINEKRNKVKYRGDAWKRQKEASDIKYIMLSP